jgi:hypothetical protein
MAEGRKPGRPQALRSDIYKTPKAASLAGRKAGHRHMPGTKKMCKYLAKFAKIDATVKQLAGNKRTQKDG